MSTIDSGVNSFATVATVDFGRFPEQKREESNVFQARIITLLVGLLVTLAAIYLDMLTGVDDIPTMLSKNSTLWWEQWGDCSWPAVIVGLVAASWLPIPATCCRPWGHPRSKS